MAPVFGKDPMFKETERPLRVRMGAWRPSVATGDNQVDFNDG